MRYHPENARIDRWTWETSLWRSTIEYMVNRRLSDGQIGIIATWVAASPYRDNVAMAAADVADPNYWISPSAISSQTVLMEVIYMGKGEPFIPEGDEAQ